MEIKKKSDFSENFDIFFVLRFKTKLPKKKYTQNTYYVYTKMLIFKENLKFLKNQKFHNTKLVTKGFPIFLVNLVFLRKNM